MIWFFRLFRIIDSATITSCNQNSHLKRTIINDVPAINHVLAGSDRWSYPWGKIARKFGCIPGMRKQQKKARNAMSFQWFCVWYVIWVQLTGLCSTFFRSKRTTQQLHMCIRRSHTIVHKNEPTEWYVEIFARPATIFRSIINHLKWIRTIVRSYSTNHTHTQRARENYIVYYFACASMLTAIANGLIKIIMKWLLLFAGQICHTYSTQHKLNERGTKTEETTTATVFTAMGVSSGEGWMAGRPGTSIDYC